MLKNSLKILSIFLLIVIIIVPTYISLVSSATGYIRINNTSDSDSGQTIDAGDDVNLYFGDVTWDGTETYLLMSLDSNNQPSVGDVIYTPVISVYDITNQTHTNLYSTGMGDWLVGNNWVNGSTASNIPAGFYYIKAFDSIGADVTITDVSIEVYSVVNGTLELTPSFGPGGINVTMTGQNYDPSTSVTIEYYDSEFGQWNILDTTMSNATGYIEFKTEVPDLKRSLGAGDNAETYTLLSYRTRIGSIIYAYADYNQNLRGIQTVDTVTASGLYGNGTNLSSTVIVEAGDNITISGKWFHPGVIYVRWDGHDIVGTVTSSEWDSAIIVGTSVANQSGYFEATIEIPSASEGEHYLAIEDSQSRVMIKIYLYFASFQVSPSSGPGGIDVTFTGSNYQPLDVIDILYHDPIFDSWNLLSSTTANETGQISFVTEIPDLHRSLWQGDYSENYNQISFRAENETTIYGSANYYQFARGLKTVGDQTAVGLFGNGTDLSASVIVNRGDELTISGKWFNPGVIYVRWDGTSVVGTVTSSEWEQATIIGTSVANQTGYFETTVTIPTAQAGIHYVCIEDSEIIFPIKITLNIPSVFDLFDFSTPFTNNTRIVVPVSDDHGPCGGAHTMDTMGGILIANTLGLDGGSISTAMDTYSYVSTYDGGSAAVTMTDTSSNLVVVAGCGVNQVSYYYNELMDEGSHVVPVVFGRDGQGDYLQVQSSTNIYRIEYDQSTVVADYGVVQIVQDGSRYVLLVYGLGGEATKAAAQVVAEYDQWTMAGHAVIIKYYDSDYNGYLDTIQIVETVP